MIIEVRRPCVPHTPEIDRILGLPRRVRTDDPALVEKLTNAFRRPEGTQRLRAIQAAALAELHACRGLFASVRVGGGKTLISYLAPEFLNAKRPILFVPAKLRDKTRREFRVLAQHWFGPHPEAFRIESYELLGRASAERLLLAYQPDLIILDEAHKAKNRRAAVTRRLARHLSQFATPVVAMSGTMCSKSLRDYAHLVHWSLPRFAPVPRGNDVDHWADALDAHANDEDRRIDAGALTAFSAGVSTLSAVRTGLRKRLTETPGVIATEEGALGTSLTVGAVIAPDDSKLDPAFETLRKVWELPDGQTISDGLEYWRHERELALGFFYRWNPAPPIEWATARSAWAKTVREILKHSRKMDSAEVVAKAIDAATAEDKVPPGGYEAADALRAWRGIRDSFVPNTEIVWLTDSVIQDCARWLAEQHAPSILWVEHIGFGKALAKALHLPYYRQQGRDARGRSVSEHTGADGSLVASIASISEGQNLQWCANNLVISPPTTGRVWEQMIGRTHRDGQKADEVIVDVVLGCARHVAEMYKARELAQYIEQTTGQSQKLCYCDYTIPVVIEKTGARWIS